MKKTFTLRSYSSVISFRFVLPLLFIVTLLLSLQKVNGQSCSPRSTLPCNQLQVSLPFNLSFDNAVSNTLADKNGAGTGFTLVDPYTGTRLSQDGSPSNASVSGYEPSKLILAGGRLQISTNKGVAYLASNNQLNTLGVEVNGQAGLQTEVTLINPFNGTAGQQAGLRIGVNDKTFLKLVVSANKITLRREINDASSTANGTSNPDQRLTTTISGLDAKTVRLRLVIDAAQNTAQGFYSIDGGATYVNVAAGYSTPSLSVAGMGLTGTSVQSGVFATHSNATTPITYTFDNFSIQNLNQRPVFSSANYIFSLTDNAALSTLVGTANASDPDGDPLTYAIATGNTNGAFSIDAATGVIKLAKLLNHHTQDQYILRIGVHDTEGLSDSATVTINVALGTTVPAFDIISWGTAASQPYSISESQGKVVNGKLYTFGGFDSQKSGFTPTSRAYVFDPVANTWTPIAPMPPMNGTNRGGVTHSGFATDGSDIYFAGGYTSNASGTGQIFGTKEVWKYIVAENRYMRLPDLPVTISAGQLEYLNGKLHFIAGTNSTRKLDLGSHYVFDLDNQAAGWKTLAPLPNPRQHAGSAVYEGKIYFIGGQHGHDDTLITQKDVHQYDPATNTWTKMADLPVPAGANGRGHISSAVIVMGDRIIVMAGEIKHNSTINLVSAYSPASNTWADLTPLPVNRYSGVAANLGGKIYYAGGSKSVVTYKGLPGVQKVMSFTLINADTNQPLFTLANGSTLNLDTLPTRNLNIRANTNFSSGGSVKFNLSGAETRTTTDDVLPYALLGDSSDDYLPWTPTPGSYTLKATPYAGAGGTGTAGTSFTVTFKVTSQSTFTLLASQKAKGETKSIQLKAYPNPSARSNIRIDIYNLGQREEAKLLLINMFGQVIETKNVKADEQGNASTFILSTGKQVTPGLYLIQVQTVAGKIENKLMVK